MFMKRNGEGSASVVAIVAIILLILIGLYFFLFRTPATPDSGDINVEVPDQVDVNLPQNNPNQ